jgi:hypothetical protein
LGGEAAALEEALEAALVVLGIMVLLDFIFSVSGYFLLLVFLAVKKLEKLSSICQIGQMGHGICVINVAF